MNDCNILKVVEDGLCTGCGTCTSLCPKKSIKMILDINKGVFLPEVDNNSCVNCGICYKVCPGHEVDFHKLNREIFGQSPVDPFIGNYTDCFIAYSCDEKIRFNASSGGLISQFLIFALEKKIIDGALVTRMNDKNPLLPEPFIARTKKEIIEASKSKYCPVPANIALKKILETPENEKFAVVGLPCHIQGIRKAASINKRLKDKIKIHIGIMCGTTKTFNATIYQLQRMNISKGNVTKISYRGEGWPGKLKVTLEDGREVLENLLNYYDGEFCSFLPWRCTLCVDHTCESSDISFGDAWIDKIKKIDKIGTSIIVVRTKSINGLLEKMKDSNIIKLQITDPINVAKSQNNFNFKKKKISARFKIFRLFGKKIPKYNKKFTSSKFSNYLISLWLFFWIYVSSKKYFWKLLKLRKVFGQIFS